jgi:hypothetical protein
VLFDLGWPVVAGLLIGWGLAAAGLLASRPGNRPADGIVGCAGQCRTPDGAAAYRFRGRLAPVVHVLRTSHPRHARLYRPCGVSMDICRLERCADEMTRFFTEGMMGKTLAGACLACVLALWVPSAIAQETTDAEFDYDAAVEDLPIESEVYEPPLTFNLTSGGVMTFYGQFNPVFQSFDDGEETTSGIVDNGNWNSRVGFTIVQPSGDITLRARFETGFGFRNSALVAQDFTPEWIDWQRPRCAGSRWQAIRDMARSPSARAARPPTARRGSTTPSPSMPARRIPPTASAPSASATSDGN